MVKLFKYNGQVDYDFDQRMMELKEEEEKQKEYRKNLKRKRKPEPEPEEMVMEISSSRDQDKIIRDRVQLYPYQVGDPDMMAMMGFSGFGGSKKNWWPASYQ